MGLLLAFWFGFSILLAVVASARGRSGFGWCLFALVVSPLVAGILLALLPSLKNEAVAQPPQGGLRKCPFCAELIQREAIRCRHCGSAVERLRSDDGSSLLAYRIGLLLGSKSGRIGVVVTLCLGIALFYGSQYLSDKRARQEQEQAMTRATQLRLAREARQAAAKKEQEEQIARTREQKPQLYRDALGLLAAEKYDQALDLLKRIASVDPNYEELPAKMKLAEAAIQKAKDKENREAERIAADAKAKAERSTAEAQARERRLSREQNRNGLTAKVSFSGTQFTITNESAQPWTEVRLEINRPGVFSSGYTFDTHRIESKKTYTVGIMQFANGDGDRFNPFQKKIQKFDIRASLPDGRIEFWHGTWQ